MRGRKGPSRGGGRGEREWGRNSGREMCNLRSAVRRPCATFHIAYRMRIGSRSVRSKVRFVRGHRGVGCKIFNLCNGGGLFSSGSFVRGRRAMKAAKADSRRNDRLLLASSFAHDNVAIQLGRATKL